MTFGDGGHSQVLGKGTIKIPGLPLLTDVLYIKRLKANLLNITQIYDEDFLVQFSKKVCLTLNKDVVQVLKGLRTTNNCYGMVPNRMYHVEVPELIYWSYGTNALDMPITSKWKTFRSLKP